jgi:hypothetical protein
MVMYVYYHEMAALSGAVDFSAQTIMYHAASHYTVLIDLSYIVFSAVPGAVDIAAHVPH